MSYYSFESVIDDGKQTTIVTQMYDSSVEYQSSRFDNLSPNTSYTVEVRVYRVAENGSRYGVDDSTVSLMISTLSGQYQLLLHIIKP